MAASRWQQLLSSLLFVGSLYLVNAEQDRTNLSVIFGLYSLAFATYLFIYKNRIHFDFKYLVGLAVLSQIVSIIHLPNLSNDYFRFLWDGEITWLGYNPLNYKPNELIEFSSIHSSEYLSRLYEGCGSLSQRHYTVYPTINQLYFLVATSFSNSIYVNVLVLKLLIIVTELVGAIYLFKTLKLLKIDTSRMWLLLLNPLWIIECTGNVHFEGVMVSFLFIAFYFLVQAKIVSSLFLAIAVHVKLVPLILFPFFYRFLGIQKSFIVYTVSGVLILLLGLIYIDKTNMYYFLESMQLYFQAFEFNAFILHYTVEFGKYFSDYYRVDIYGPILSKITVGIIAILAFYGKIDGWKVLFKRMTIAFFVYLLLSSTLHPWYIVPLVALSIFTNYSFPLLWSFLIFFSYAFYSSLNHHEGFVRWVINLEYILVIGLFFFEISKKGSPFKFLRID